MCAVGPIGESVLLVVLVQMHGKLLLPIDEAVAPRVIIVIISGRVGRADGQNPVVSGEITMSSPQRNDLSISGRPFGRSCVVVHGITRQLANMLSF